MPSQGCVLYERVPSVFGEVGIVRLAGEGRGPVQRILLPVENWTMAERIVREFPLAQPAPAPGALAGLLARFLAGEAVAFSGVTLDLAGLPAFTQRALAACRQIPRGRVTTYGALAAGMGAPGAARAVGNAMAMNPFALVIPCHRVVAHNGALGGYSGGRRALPMKRALLEQEGVAFDSRGRVLPCHWL